MNPLRYILSTVSRIPPAVILLIIIGLAVLTSMIVTDKVSQEENRLQAEQSSRTEYVVMSADAIPASTEIDKTMIVQRRALEKEIWSDAIKSKANAVGRVTEKAIPAHSQIRECDLQ
ncbi:MAG: hypothetical protein K2Y39_18955 [Candidatus Obscuribacterales bacterium]|nr:hypothetical protein [Candidatus Obscuribacterales bacterium]